MVKMILSMLILITANLAHAGSFGEDPGNLECTKSIHRPREVVASIKSNTEYENTKEGEEADSTKTISK